MIMLYLPRDAVALTRRLRLAVTIWINTNQQGPWNVQPDRTELPHTGRIMQSLLLYASEMPAFTFSLCVGPLWQCKLVVIPLAERFGLLCDAHSTCIMLIWNICCLLGYLQGCYVAAALIFMSFLPSKSTAPSHFKFMWWEGKHHHLCI